MQRYAITIGLRPQCRRRYLELHTSVWPDVESMLTRANISNFTIFVHGDTLFGYYEYLGDDHDADQARIAADDATQRWWALTDACQQRQHGTPEGAQWAPMAEVWHQD